jgi:hypothetical protein
VHDAHHEVTSRPAMTNSHEPMRIEEVAPTSAPDSIEEGDIRVLGSYGRWQSDMMTLVGLGKPERLAERQGVPQSEPPGPWGSHAAEDEESIPPSLRRSKLGIWSVAIPLLVVLAGATGIALFGLNPESGRATAVSAAAQLPPVDNAGLFVRVSDKTVRVSLDGQDRGAGPMLITGLAPGSHALTITGSGYETFEQPVLLVQDQVSTIEPMLTPVSTKEPEPIAVHDLAPATGSKSGVAAKVASVPGTKPLAVVLAENAGSTPALSSNPYQPGKLSISSVPPAAVVVDGRPVGKAPRAVDLPPGLHTVVFIHPTQGRRSVTVNVLSGRETSASVEF